MMRNYHRRFLEYYQTKMYRGFQETDIYTDKLHHVTHCTFTDGNRSFFASGQFKEEALIKVFDRIDHYYATK